jgi:hypothetical protein
MRLGTDNPLCGRLAALSPKASDRQKTRLWTHQRNRRGGRKNGKRRKWQQTNPLVQTARRGAESVTKGIQRSTNAALDWSKDGRGSRWNGGWKSAEMRLATDNPPCVDGWWLTGRLTWGGVGHQRHPAMVNKRGFGLVKGWERQLMEWQETQVATDKNPPCVDG